MEKNIFEKIDEIYKNELDSHNLKINKNSINDSLPFKANELLLNQNKNIKNNKDNEFINKNMLISKKKFRKECLNTNFFEQNEKIEESFKYNNNFENLNKEEKINRAKVNKRNSVKLKVCKAFKKFQDNLNSVQLLNSNKDNSKQKVTKRISFKNYLSCKRDILNSQSSKRYSKLIDKKNKNEIEIYNINTNKRKKSDYKSNNTNHDFEIEKNKNNNENYKEEKNNKNNVNKHLDNNYINSDGTKKRKMIEKTNNELMQKNIYKNTNINNKNIEVLQDSDNEVEYNILYLLEKPLKKKKRNSIVNTRKRKHYGTQEFNEKIFQNLPKYFGLKKYKSNDIEKISLNENNLIKKKENNNLNFNNEFLMESNEINVPTFKSIYVQKVVSLEFNDKNDLNKENEHQVDNYLNKKKLIIYNNFNYFKTTQKDENHLENLKENNQEYYINNVNKNDININNNKKIVNKKDINNCFKCIFNCCLPGE